LAVAALSIGFYKALVKELAVVCYKLEGIGAGGKGGDVDGLGAVGDGEGF
jgi:hypothetical protein